MARRPLPHRPVHHAGKTYPVIGEERVHGQPVLLLEQLGASDRPRYRAFDPRAGRRGELRRLTVLPKSPDSRQHLDTLFRSRRTNDAFSVVLAWEERKDTFVVVNEWVEGNDLASYLDRVRSGRLPPISPREAVRLVKGLAHGLDWLHAHAGVIHADLKPANLILNRNARRLVLVDYGSAWPVEITARRTIGDGLTASYAAPELQGATGVVNGRVDQFAASVILYEMLTGKLPYTIGGKAGRPEYAAEMGPCYQPPSALAPNRTPIPKAAWDAIDRLVAPGVAFEPDRRFRTDREWLTALEFAWRELDPLPAPDREPNGVVARVVAFFRGR